jgi:hypothetical protein
MLWALLSSSSRISCGDQLWPPATGTVSNRVSAAIGSARRSAWRANTSTR